MRVSTGQRAQIIADYKAAFAAANGGDAIDVRRNGSWYQLGRTPSSFRLKDIVEFTKVLQARAQAAHTLEPHRITELEG